jgi:HlyD family secretion protein
MKKSIIITVAIGAGLFIATRLIRGTQPEEKPQPFLTATPVTTTIRHTVTTSGTLRLKESSRVGSLVAGTVESLLVEENDEVTKGQLLATLDNGKKDTAIRMTRGALEQAQAEYDYQNAVLTREKELYAEGLRSQQEFEGFERSARAAHGALLSAQAHHDAALLEFENTFIKAPDDGVVILVGVKKGFKVTTDLEATVLFEIARDTNKMEAELTLEEANVSSVKPGQPVRFTVDAYPDKVFKTTIKKVSYAPYKTQNGLVYKAIVDIDNSQGLLFPGMTIHATVKVEKAKDVVGVDATAFYLDGKQIEQAAALHGLAAKALSSDEKKKRERGAKPVKYLWILRDDNSVEEVSLETGVSDDRYVHAHSGIGEKDSYLLDTLQASAMDKHYKSMFKGAL